MKNVLHKLALWVFPSYRRNFTLITELRDELLQLEDSVKLLRADAEWFLGKLGVRTINTEELFTEYKCLLARDREMRRRTYGDIYAAVKSLDWLLTELPRYCPLFDEIEALVCRFEGSGKYGFPSFRGDAKHTI
jgi:hypothetical protein